MQHGPDEIQHLLCDRAAAVALAAKHVEWHATRDRIGNGRDAAYVNDLAAGRSRCAVDAGDHAWAQ